jgi:hypothetical protein
MPSAPRKNECSEIAAHGDCKFAVTMKTRRILIGTLHTSGVSAGEGTFSHDTRLRARDSWQASGEIE